MKARDGTISRRVSFCLLLAFAVAAVAAGCDSDEGAVDVGGKGDAPASVLVSFEGCKYTFHSEPPFPGTNDIDCIEYDYSDGALGIRHINAGFNCCPKYDIVVTVHNGVITINEIELEGLCDCLCLFDLELKITGLTPGSYTIRVIEPYLPEGDDKLDFTVDFTGPVSGTECVTRSKYPWGVD